MRLNIVVLPGDGIGPEVIAAARQVLEPVANLEGCTFTYSEYKIGGCAIDEYGTALPDDTLQASLKADAVLLGAVGGPKWDDPAAPVRPEQGLLALRKAMGVYANLRPVKFYPRVAAASPLKPERLAGVDMMILRELTGGLYFGQPRGRSRSNGCEHVVDTLEYSELEIERIVDLAFRLAMGRRKKVTSIDKANVLESSRLWRQVATHVAQKYPQVTLEHMLVDTAAMRLISHPANFDVVVTENMFGDILSDEASILPGSMGVLPSASLGDGTNGLYEPIHGSAPDIVGKGVANPIGTILSAAFMLRYSLQLEHAANRVEWAVEHVISDGKVTPDLGGTCSTTEVADAVVAYLHRYDDASPRFVSQAIHSCYS